MYKGIYRFDYDFWRIPEYDSIIIILLSHFLYVHTSRLWIDKNRVFVPLYPSGIFTFHHSHFLFLTHWEICKMTLRFCVKKRRRRRETSWIVTAMKWNVTEMLLWVIMTKVFFQTSEVAKYLMKNLLMHNEIMFKNEKNLKWNFIHDEYFTMLRAQK